MTESFNQKEAFYKKLRDFYALKSRKQPFTKEQQKTMIEEIQAAKLKQHSKTRREYFLLQTYDVLSVGDEQFLIKKNHDRNSTDVVYVVAYEDLYVRLYDVHVNATGHDGHLKMRQALNKKLSIPRSALECFLATCESCNKKKGVTRKLDVRPVISKDFNERGQVVLIDFQSIPYGPYKWIMNYQDHATKFICLRARQTKRVAEVAKELLSIFLTFGAPKILQSDNGREFVNYVIEELKDMWPECVIVNGRPRHPQNQESVEGCNQDVENILRSWMTDNNSKKWFIGIQFVQWQKNISYHKVIGRSPYKALFGGEPRVGLTTSNIPKDHLHTLQNEEDLDKFKNDVDKNIELNAVDNLGDGSTAVELNTSNDNHVNAITEEELNVFSNKSEGAVDAVRMDTNEEDETNITLANTLVMREQQIKIERAKVRTGQKRATEQILNGSRTMQKKFNKGDCVLLSIPKADRGLM